MNLPDDPEEDSSEPARTKRTAGRYPADKVLIASNTGFKIPFLSMNIWERNGVAPTTIPTREARTCELVWGVTL